MSILQNIQDLLGQTLSNGSASGARNTPNPSANPSTGDSMLSSLSTGLSGLFGADSQTLSKLLGPAALGGIAGALLGSKSARTVAGGALLAGGGAMLWDKYKDRMKEAYAKYTGQSEVADGEMFETQDEAARKNLDTQAKSVIAQGPVPSSTAEDRAQRLIRALVFAAKSDGHIDDKEQTAIFDKLKELNLGSDTRQLVQEAMQQPLDPALIADGVKNEDEALEVFTLSCTVINVDHFMERSYLDGLAKALKIPDDVKEDIMNKLKPQ